MAISIILVQLYRVPSTVVFGKHLLKLSLILLYEAVLVLCCNNLMPDKNYYFEEKEVNIIKRVYSV